MVASSLQVKSWNTVDPCSSPRLRNQNRDGDSVGFVVNDPVHSSVFPVSKGQVCPGVSTDPDSLSSLQ